AKGRATVSESDAAPAHTGIADECPQEFLDPPRFEWLDRPRFVTRLVGIANLDLAEDTYDVCLGGRRVDSLIRQPDGSYPGDPDRTYPVPDDAPAVPANLVVRHSRSVVATQELSLWDSDAEVTVYRLSDGRPLDPKDRLNPQQAYAVRAASD